MVSIDTLLSAVLVYLLFLLLGGNSYFTSGVESLGYFLREYADQLGFLTAVMIFMVFAYANYAIKMKKTIEKAKSVLE